eukprot:1389213-Karenia_brevis.AAC.1
MAMKRGGCIVSFVAVQHALWDRGYQDKIHPGATTNAAQGSLHMSGLKCGSVGKAQLKIGYCAKVWNVTSASMSVDAD